MGHAFAMSTCGSCHAVEPGSITSPDPNAPPFQAFVNKQGLTKETLSVCLRDAHNYPDEMQFQLDPGKADDLVTFHAHVHGPFLPASPLRPQSLTE